MDTLLIPIFLLASIVPLFKLYKSNGVAKPSQGFVKEWLTCIALWLAIYFALSLCGAAFGLIETTLSKPASIILIGIILLGHLAYCIAVIALLESIRFKLGKVNRLSSAHKTLFTVAICGSILMLLLPLRASLTLLLTPFILFEQHIAFLATNII